MKKKSLGILMLALAAACTLGAGIGANAPQVSAAEGVGMQSDGDSFLLGSASYAAGESFVYTATAYFNNAESQAAGIAFGAAQGDHYWVFNVDRAENRVKLLYFTGSEGNYSATELKSDWYLGNDLLTESERSLVNPKVRTIPSVQLKVVVSAEIDGVYAEFYADNIRRFGLDEAIRLNDLQPGITYTGGALGFNVFHADVRFDSVYDGASDYSYYTELYRQQYHFSQYAHWNNDPNGLVYYDGYYHVFYQHNPFGNTWGDMYWGHARSADLAHWELLPVCLFPDADYRGNTAGFMWSGSAMVYRRGMSAAIDDAGWFSGESGLIAFYTRDGAMQDQMIMSSDDGGMTWTKRKLIEQQIATGAGSGRTDCRDPKVFPVETSGESVTRWGMILSGMATNDIWFLQSEDLLNWSYAGGFKAEKPECPDLVTVRADDGTDKTVISLTGRRYLVGRVAYEGGMIRFYATVGGEERDLSALDLSEIPFETMDYGPDSYATQTFYIDDATSAYHGKTVSLSWFSGVPGAAASIESGSLAALRKVWNGGGMTIPVVWGLKSSDGKYLLTQTPIVKDSDAFDKTQLYAASDVVVRAGENLLAGVEGRNTEIAATVENPNGVPVAFRVRTGGEEYTEIGWNQTEGYYVDRSHTSDGGLTMNAYRARFTSGARPSETQTFYLLVDDGGLEVFCEDFTVPFYVLTFAFPASTGLSFTADGEATVTSLTVNEIGSVWRDGTAVGEDTALYLTSESLELDLTITKEKEILAYSIAGGEIAWSVESGEDVVALTETAQGVRVTAVGGGEAVIKASCMGDEKFVTVTVESGAIGSDLSFSQSGILSGEWLMTENGVVAKQPNGDGFILTNASGRDFVYTVRCNLGEGVAAAVVFRATADLSEYYIANYDRNENIVKLWSARRELMRVPAGEVNSSDFLLSVTAVGNNVKVSLNGRQMIDVTDTDEGAPTEGLLGLNVCATRQPAVFSMISYRSARETYTGGSLSVKGDSEQYISAVYNRTLGNVRVNAAFYQVSGRTITIGEAYFSSLKVGVYEFYAVGSDTTFEFVVEVLSTSGKPIYSSEIDYGCDAAIYTGAAEIGTVKVNGRALAATEYEIKNGTVTIYASALTVGENVVQLSDTLTVTVTVNEQAVIGEATESGGGLGTGAIVGISVGCSAAGLAAIGTVVFLAVRRRRKHGDDD